MPSHHPLVVFGDWHGNLRWATSAIRRVSGCADEFYHVGDFGLWTLREPIQVDGRIEMRPTREWRYLQTVNAALIDARATLHVVLGNHENYRELDRAFRRHHGGMVFPGVEHIRFWPRVNTHLNVGSGLRIAALGGAGSIDRGLRVEGVDWWPEEEITAADLAEFKATVTPGSVDVFLSHEAPAGVPNIDDTNPPSYATPDVVNYCNRQRVLVREALDWAAPKWAFYGHWHDHHVNEFSGVQHDGEPYDATMVALDMDGNRGNVVSLGPTGHLRLPLR